MRCIILAEDNDWKELFEDKEAFVHLYEVHTPEEFSLEVGEAYFDFRNEIWDAPFWPLKNGQPIFIAGVAGTLKDHHCPDQIIRLNSWPGMLKHDLVECVGSDKIRPLAQQVLNALNKTASWLPDHPGMVSPRVLSMIINEAWFALGEGVSTKKDIDTAMKLGTNYPLGPFEWGAKIGLHRICHLLYTLNIENERYRIAPLLLREIGL